MPVSSAKKIPKPDVLDFVIRDILRKKRVSSQKELAELVNRKFSESGSGYRVSPERARLAALNAGSHLVIATRKGAAPTACPGCGHKLKKSYIRNLKGKTAVYGMRCPRCGYDGRLGRFAPGRYGFSRI